MRYMLFCLMAVACAGETTTTTVDSGFYTDSGFYWSTSDPVPSHITCSDGSVSPSCTSCTSGCCSGHGGC